MIKVFIPRQGLYNAGRDSLMFNNTLDIIVLSYMTVRKCFVMSMNGQQNICRCKDAARTKLVEMHVWGCYIVEVYYHVDQH